MSDDNKKSVTPGNNEIAVRLRKEAATALHAHVNSGTPLAEDPQDQKGIAGYLGDKLGMALDTEANEKKEPLAPRHDGQVVMLMAPATARALQLALKEGTQLDYSIKTDLARRLQDALAADGTPVKGVSLPPPGTPEGVPTNPDLDPGTV